MTFLKKIKHTLPDSKSLRKALHDKLRGADYERTGPYLHMSDLTRQELEFCPRAKAFATDDPSLRQKQWISTCQQYTFDMGTYYHHQFNNVWARHIAIGNWHCPKCEHVTKFCEVPDKCPNCSCDGARLQYKEVVVKHPTLALSGSFDSIVKLGPSTDWVFMVELKSMANDEFKALKAPLGEHRLRTCAYRRLLSESDSPIKAFVNPTKVLVLYMTKGYGGVDPTLESDGIQEKMSPFKEFFIDVNDNFSQTDVIWDRAREYTRYTKNEVAFPKGICSTVFEPRAMKCNACAKCFSGDPKYPWPTS